MGYMKIPNLYKDISVLQFREVYALEKIHGTSANVRYSEGQVWFSSGGSKHDTFVGLFDARGLNEKFLELGHDEVVVYGEAYGGSIQRMSGTYGKSMKFVAFEVKVGDTFLNVDNARDVTMKLGLEFVHYVKGPGTLEFVNEQRDAPSVQAVRNGCGAECVREGIVIRPLEEYVKSNDSRVMSKHKSEQFCETKTPREVDPDRLKVLSDCTEIAEEWVTDMRLSHVLDKLPEATGMEHTKLVISAMIKDVMVEGEDEMEWNKDVSRAIARKAAELWKAKCMKIPQEKGGDAQ